MNTRDIAWASPAAAVGFTYGTCDELVSFAIAGARDARNRLGSESNNQRGRGCQYTSSHGLLWPSDDLSYWQYSVVPTAPPGRKNSTDPFWFTKAKTGNTDVKTVYQGRGNRPPKDLERPVMRDPYRTTGLSNRLALVVTLV